MSSGIENFGIVDGLRKERICQDRTLVRQAPLRIRITENIF